jgi:hypothetical protein
MRKKDDYVASEPLLESEKIRYHLLWQMIKVCETCWNAQMWGRGRADRESVLHGVLSGLEVAGLEAKRTGDMQTAANVAICMSVLSRAYDMAESIGYIPNQPEVRQP